MTVLSKLPGNYERLSNVEFDWDPDYVTELYPAEGLAPYIPLELMIKAIKLMKCGKAAGTSLIIDGMLKASGAEGAWQVRDLVEDIIHLGKIPTEWEDSIIVSLYNDKWVRKLSRPQIPRPGHGGSREGGWELPTTTFPDVDGGRFVQHITRVFLFMLQKTNQHLKV